MPRSQPAGSTAPWRCQRSPSPGSSQIPDFSIAPALQHGNLLTRKADAGMRRARRRQRQIDEVGTPREMPVVEAPRAAAVEGDGADQRMRIEQPVDRVRPLPADRRVGAGLALSELADVPQRDPMRCDKGQPVRVIGCRGLRRTRQKRSARTDCADGRNTRAGAAIPRPGRVPSTRTRARASTIGGKLRFGGRGGRLRRARLSLDVTAEADRRLALDETPRRHDQHAIIIGRAHLAAVVAADQGALCAAAPRVRENPRRTRSCRR